MCMSVGAMSAALVVVILCSEIAAEMPRFWYHLLNDDNCTNMIIGAKSSRSLTKFDTGAAGTFDFIPALKTGLGINFLPIWKPKIRWNISS